MPVSIGQIKVVLLLRLFWVMMLRPFTRWWPGLYIMHSCHVLSSLCYIIDSNALRLQEGLEVELQSRRGEPVGVDVSRRYEELKRRLSGSIRKFVVLKHGRVQNTKDTDDLGLAVKAEVDGGGVAGEEGRVWQVGSSASTFAVIPTFTKQSWDEKTYR